MVRVDCSDYQVEVDGEVYHPHEGEWVEVRRMPGIGAILMAQRLASLEETWERIGQDESATRRAAEDLEFIAGAVARAIPRWSWTDDDENPYPVNPTKEVIESLEIPETIYLAGVVFRGGRPLDQVDEEEADQEKV